MQTPVIWYAIALIIASLWWDNADNHPKLFLTTRLKSERVRYNYWVTWADPGVLSIAVCEQISVNFESEFCNFH